MKYKILIILLTFLLFGCSKDYVRVRILPNSNELSDQLQKEEIKEIVINYLNQNKLSIDELINELNIELSKKYQNIKITKEKEYFELKVLNGKLIPSGMYDSIVIRINEGKGNNWWGILYPEFYGLDYDDAKEVEYRSIIIDSISRLD